MILTNETNVTIRACLLGGTSERRDRSRIIGRISGPIVVMYVGKKRRK